MKLSHYLFGLIFCALCFGAFLEVIATLSHVSIKADQYGWFCVGFLGYIMFLGIGSAAFSQNFQFFRTFTHELTHTIFSFLSFKKVRHFQVSSQNGGEIHVVGGSNMLILLSPYCIPIYTLIFILIKPLFQAKFMPYIEAGIGMTYFFHLHTNWLQTGTRQTDITRYPLLTSYSFIFLFHCLFFGIILLSFQLGLSAFWKVPVQAFNHLQLFFSHL